MRLYVGVHLKITKRFFIILICFAFALCLIIQTGCNSDDSITPITIRFWHTYTGKQSDIFAMLVDTYNTTEGKSRNVFVVAEYKTQEEITIPKNKATIAVAFLHYIEGNCVEICSLTHRFFYGMLKIS